MSHHAFAQLDHTLSSDAQPFGFQLKTVVMRANLSFYRNADYQFTRLFNHISIGLIVGLTFLKVGDLVADLQYRIFSIFTAGVLPVLVCLTTFQAFDVMPKLISPSTDHGSD